MADSMYVAGELYRKCVPGLKGTGWAKKRRTHEACRRVESAPVNIDGSLSCPVFMRSKSRTRMRRRFSDGDAGASSGKKLSTRSSRLSFPSAAANPTAVDVKLLLREYSMCGVRASYGAHQPSATTCPCRTIMTLF